MKRAILENIKKAMHHQLTPYHHTGINRRKFIAHSIQAAGSLALLGLPSLLKAANVQPATQYTVQQVIDIILKEGNLETIPGTVDTIKAGSADAVVTGIVTTMFATTEVIEKAAALNANFIIAHEPTFYNHLDKTDLIKNNSVVKQKQALLQKHHITVWRFHDYCHSLVPDAVLYGVVKKAGWLPYFKNNENLLTIPPIPLQQLVQHLKKSLGIAHVRVIGNLQQNCTRIALLPGAGGGEAQVGMLEADKPDVLIVGEVSEWETAEYVRDATLQGKKTALIILGHALSEEPGMEYFVDWLQPKITGIKVAHIASGEPFIWM